MIRGILISVILLLWIGNLHAQTTEINSCYRKTVSADENVFTKMLHYPHYKGYEKALNLFLISELNITAIANSLIDSVNVFEDSVNIRFIISRKAQMSDISASSSNKILAAEIEKAFIKSSCNWVPGGTERYFTGWYTGVVYFKLDRRYRAFSVTVSSLSKQE